MLTFIDQVKWFTCSKAQNVWWELNQHLLNLCCMFQLKDAPSSLLHFSLNKNEPVQKSQPEADKGSGLFSRSGWELQEQKMCVRSVATLPIFIFCGHLTGLEPNAAAIPAVCGALYLRLEWYLLSFLNSAGFVLRAAGEAPVSERCAVSALPEQTCPALSQVPRDDHWLVSTRQGGRERLFPPGAPWPRHPFFCVCGAGERLL